jgi:biotin carboxyl carrier protein
MPKYAAQIDGKRFEVDINDTATEARFNGETLNFDSIWLAGSRQNINILLGGRSYDLRIEEQDDHLLITYAGQRYECTVADKRVADLKRRAESADRPHGKTVVKSPMPGLVVKVLAAEGQEVKRGERLIVLEAMKMENDVKSPRDGRIAKIAVQTGDPVEGGRELLTIE